MPPTSRHTNSSATPTAPTNEVPARLLTMAADYRNIILHATHSDLESLAIVQRTTVAALVAEGARNPWYDGLVEALMVDHLGLLQLATEMGERDLAVGVMGHLAGLVCVAVGFGAGYYMGKHMK
ncbi:hypothetical protein LTR08_006840 [Meristemomyces frigidus]|nr:hypothetical protein LTR08_006840 [Meristemomyces frigidus]